MVRRIQRVSVELIDLVVMAGHSRSKNGGASLAYVPAIHVVLCGTQDVMRESSPRMTP